MLALLQDLVITLLSDPHDLDMLLLEGDIEGD